MVALNQLALGYEDIDQYQAAVEILEHLAAQFPENPMEVWFRLGELYERRLRNADKARAAYEKVPGRLAALQEAQQRLKRQLEAAFALALPSTVLISTLPVTTSIEMTGSPLPSVASLHLGPQRIARRHRDVRLNRAVQRERHHSRIGRRAGHLSDGRRR